MSALSGDVLTRFASKVALDDNGCLVWITPPNAYGYGHMNVGGRKGSMRLAHRLMWEHVVGPISEGYEVDHLCRVRACCLPEHLDAVPKSENLRRQFVARTICKNAHPLPPYEGSYRRCLPCHRAEEARRLARKRATA